VSAARAARCGVLAVLLASCGSQGSSPPPSLSITADPGAPLAAGLTENGVSLPVGIVLQIEATTNGYPSNAVVTARADDPSRVDAIPTVTPDSFVLAGVAPGQTTLRFFVNGQPATNLGFGGAMGGAVPIDVEPQVVEP
jgi:hypothetical protein